MAEVPHYYSRPPEYGTPEYDASNQLNQLFGNWARTKLFPEGDVASFFLMFDTQRLSSPSLFLQRAALLQDISPMIVGLIREGVVTGEKMAGFIRSQVIEGRHEADTLTVCLRAISTVHYSVIQKLQAENFGASGTIITRLLENPDMGGDFFKPFERSAKEGREAERKALN